MYSDLSACGWGGYAEYVCVPEKDLLHKPEWLTYEEAASLPQGGAMAVQGLRGKVPVQPGQKVLINGAGGSVGALAIQVARVLGAEVTAVDKENKFEWMRSLGADHVIDYQKKDFTRCQQRYDLILYVIGKHSIYDIKRTLRPGGIFRMVGGASSLIFQAMFLGPVLSLTSNKKLGILAHRPNKELDFLAELIRGGKVCSVIDRTFPLDEIPDAFRYYLKGNFRGKIIINI